MGGKGKGDVASVSGMTPIGLPVDCRIAGLETLHRQLREALGAAQCTLDGGAVERVDTAALQLLLAFRRDAQMRGQQASWAAVSAALREAANLLGLAQTLALPA